MLNREPLCKHVLYLCRVHGTGTVSSLDVGVSNSVVEAGVAALSQHMDTVLQLRETLTHPHRKGGKNQPQPRDRFYRYLSQEEPTDSRLLEVVDSVNESSSHISKQALQGRKSFHASKKALRTGKYPYSRTQGTRNGSSPYSNKQAPADGGRDEPDSK